MRDERGLTQEELAQAAGLHRNYASSAERGERNVSLINIAKLADALGVRPGELLSLAEELAPRKTSA